MLTVLSRVEGSGGGNKHTRWICQCDCGKITEVASSHLTSSWRPIQSCGCLKKALSSTTYKDITGQKFGLLTALEIAERQGKNRHLRWLCICECGAKTIVDYSDLIKGKTISCGCKAMSKAEIQIRKELNKYKIDFKSQFLLLDLTTKAGGTPRMDFAIYDQDQLLAFIEFQGEQHYKDFGIWGKTAREETDQMKKEYCSKIGIPLFEIKYNEDIPSSVAKILSTLKLIPCQAA